MPLFQPIGPSKVIEACEAASVKESQRLISDFAAAGLIRSYALVLESIAPRGERKVVRGGTVPPDLWQRIIAEGEIDVAWTGGTVRLAGSDLRGGIPAVNITGISFHAGDVQRFVALQLGELEPISPQKAPQAQAPASPQPRARKSANPAVITSGALLISIKDTQAALGIGRTKVNELMSAGQLERVEIDGGVRITTASVRALAGLND